MFQLNILVIIMSNLVKTVIKPFLPDWISPPGETVQDLMEEHGWTEAQLVQQLGLSQDFVSELISGEALLNETVALRLHEVLGAPVSFWLVREAKYREQVLQPAAA
jgi:HTH-type transcriptional regulator / antitoxin HigA